MGLSEEKIADLRLKQLEMLQSIITRMAGFGAAFKSYCITIVTAVCGFSISLQKPSIAALALLPTLVFAMADAQYLRVERRYRALFDQVRGEEFSSMPTFDTSLKNAPTKSFWCALFSWSILFFYGVLAVGVIAVIIGARWAHG